MSIDELLTRTCTIERQVAGADADVYGDEIPETSTLETVCELQQAGRDENPGRTIADDTWQFFAPAETDIQAGDRVTVDGMAFEVHGEPWIARDPELISTSHVEATLRRAHARDDERAS